MLEALASVLLSLPPAQRLGVGQNWPELIQGCVLVPGWERMRSRHDRVAQALTASPAEVPDEPKEANSGEKEERACTPAMPTSSEFVPIANFGIPGELLVAELDQQQIPVADAPGVGDEVFLNIPSWGPPLWHIG